MKFSEKVSFLGKQRRTHLHAGHVVLSSFCFMAHSFYCKTCRSMRSNDMADEIFPASLPSQFGKWMFRKLEFVTSTVSLIHVQGCSYSGLRNEI